MPIDLNRVLIVFALESETRDYWGDVPVRYCGIGKVNAAYRLTKFLGEWRKDKQSDPSLVLNLGSAGSSSFKAGETINCTRFIQRDFDVTPLGVDAYTTPFESAPPPVISTPQRYEAYAEGICGTGDNFVTDGQMNGWNVVDMEAYALAKVCALENINFGCLKFITDGIDGHAAATWEASLLDASRSLREGLGRIVA